MENLDKELLDIRSRKKKVLSKINDLKSNEEVMYFVSLCSEFNELMKNESKICREIQFNAYSNCKHLMVITEVWQDDFEKQEHYNYGCVKCGINTCLLENNSRKHSVKDEVGYKYLTNNFKDFCSNSLFTNICCNQNWAMELYARKLNENPDMTDKEFKEFIEAKYNNDSTHMVRSLEK